MSMSSRRARQAESRARLVRRRECDSSVLGGRVVGTVFGEAGVSEAGLEVGVCGGAEVVVVVVVVVAPGCEVWGWVRAGSASGVKGDLKGLWRADDGSSRRRRLISGVDILWACFFILAVVIECGDYVLEHL